MTNNCNGDCDHVSSPVLGDLVIDRATNFAVIPSISLIEQQFEISLGRRT
jgi:hypothetical protein